MHAHCVRLYSHSLSDDENLYKSAAEREAEAARDPLALFPRYLLDEGILDRAALDRIVEEVEQEVQEASQRALQQEPPARDSAMVNLYSDRVDPTAAEFDREPEFTGAPKTMVDLINATMREEMRRNPDILVFGEDVADCSRENASPK